jgi:O-methyltransferase domain/Dimerisation domain
VSGHPEEEMLRLLSGYWSSQCLYVMAELGIADLLADGPKTADVLAKETQCHADSLHRLLRALAGTGILSEVEPRRFALTPLSQTLRSDRRDSLGPVARLGGHPLHWQAWGQLLHSVRTGQVAFDAAHGKGFFESLAEDPVMSAVFQSVQERLSVLDRAVVATVDLGPFERIVDVGGGTGALARQIASAHPRASVVLFDRDHVLATVTAAARVDLVPGNFFERVPPGAAYILKFVLHDWDDDHAALILQNCRDAMAQDGRVFVIETVVPDDDAPSPAKAHDVNMLVLTGGRERTLEEHRSLFLTAGLDYLQAIPVGFGVSVLVARASR